MIPYNKKEEEFIDYQTIVLCIFTKNLMPLYKLKKMSNPNFDLNKKIYKKLKRNETVYEINFDDIYEDSLLTRSNNEFNFNNDLTQNEIEALQAIYGAKLEKSRIKEELKKYTNEQFKELKKNISD